jgi:pimeloyl-ACP methyl ester carboxylesterase
MRILSLFLVLATIISCSHFQNTRTPSSASASKPRHLIITVHGLSGNKETFGYFGEATKQYLNILTPNYEVITTNFVYPTGKSEKLGAYDFAMGPEGLGSFIRQQFADRPLTSQDKISLVGHSQGGLVSYMWFFSTIASQGEGYAYAKQVDSIITLGTPFWGSKIASILTDENNINIIPLIKKFAPAEFKMTRREIADLAYGSDTVDAFRKMAIDLDNNPTLAAEIERLPVRLVNIIGILPSNRNHLFSNASKSGNLVSNLTKTVINFIYDVLTRSYGGEKLVESDIAVPVPSSRWNFLYTPPKSITQNTVISQTDYKDFSHLVGSSKFLFTESAHLPFDTENTLSMAYINKSCMAVETCEHPTFRYVIQHLANCKTDRNPTGNQCAGTSYDDIVQKMKAVNLKDHQYFRDVIRSSLETFAVQINIRLKPGQIGKFPEKYFYRKQSPQGRSYVFERGDFREYSLKGDVVNLMNKRETGKSKGSTKDVAIYIADRDENHSLDIVSRQANEKDPFDYIRINVTGRIEDATRTEGENYSVPLEINLPGLPKVQINALVRPSYSTFTELDYTAQ